MKQVLFIGLLINSLLLSACSGGSTLPNDDELSQFISRNLQISDVVIKDKQSCQLSANTKAEGVSERWIITYDALLPLLGQQPEKQTNRKVTIEKRDSKWIEYSIFGDCGR